MKANLIKTLKNTAELVDIEAGRSARANFPGVDFENAVLIINGKVSNPDTIIQDGDVVTLRQIPGDLTETPWWVATFIIPFGFIIQPAEIAYKAKQQADEAERELEKIKKLTNAVDIDNSPFLRGATNTLATGKSQPYFCGRNFLTPYLFSQPFYKVSGTDGETQEVYNILEFGFKDIIINKIGIGDTTIKEFDDTSPQNGIYTINEGIFANGQLEIRQDGSLFSTLTELNRKIKSNVINREIAKEYEVNAETKEYTVITLDSNAKDVSICIIFPYGMYSYDDEGNRISAEVVITSEYSLDGGNTWTQFKFNQNGTLSNTFSRNELKQLRFIADKEFTLADYQTLATNNQSCVLVRVKSNAPDDEKTRADCYLYYYQSHIYDPQKSSAPAGIIQDGGSAGLVDCLNIEDKERSYSCIAGLKLIATDNNEKKLTQINIIATSTARTWNGSAWSGKKAPTRNPAAIALEIYTSDIHPASRYDPQEEIDLAAFGALYKYCEDNDIYFDDLITQAQKKDAEIQRIADVCGCAFYKDIYGRISVAIDQAQENAIAVYNPQNIISLTNKKTFARRIDALRIKYIDSTNDTYKQNTYTVTRLENGQPVTIDEDSIIKEIEVKGITRQSQIVKYARRLMAIDELRPLTTTLKIGAEGVYFTPYAKIGIQDPSINRDAQDAVVDSVTYKSGLLKKITLKNPVTFTDPQKLYGVVINTVNANGASPLALKVSGYGTTHELDVLSKYSASATHQPKFNNVLSFGELDENGEFTKITHEYIITRIARTDGGFNLDLQEYNEAIYDAGLIPAYKPLVNNAPTPAAGEIPPNSVTPEELIDSASEAAQEALDLITTGARFTNIYKLKGMRGIPQTGVPGSNIPAIADTFETLRQELDEIRKEATDGISITDDKLTIQVSDSETRSRALIEVTAQNITQLVEDEKNDTISIIEQTAAGITQQVQEIEGNVSTLQQTASGLTTQVESINGDISTINGAIGNINNSITGINGDISDINGTIGTINGDITELSGDVSVLKQTASGLTTQVANVSTAVTTAQTTADGAVTTANEAASKAEAASTTASNAQTAADNAQTTADNAAAAVTAISTRVTTVEQTASGLTTQVSEITQNVDTITGDVQNITGDVSTLQQTAQGLRVDVTDLDRETAATFAAMKNELIAMIDDGVRDTSAGMSITADAIVLQVKNTEKDLRAEIDITAEEILIGVDAMREELTGLIDVQAGAVTALVEGGGASGSMSLSLNLPIMIDATTRAKLVNASTEAKVEAVYALIKGSEYYGIKGNASDQAVKALWDDAVAGNLIASQIVLDANQINIAGKTIFTKEGAQSDATAKANAAQSAAAADATQKANAAQSNAVATAASQRNEMATKLGYASYDAMVQAASNGQTIINGGYLRTSLIEVDNLLAQNIVLKQQGFIKSHNYAESGGSPTAGFMLDAANNVIKTYGMKANEASITGSIESEHFDPNNKNYGYKFYEDGNVARGIIPLLETYQIKSTVANEPVFFFNRGLAASVFTKIGTITRYTNWNSIFSILGFLNGRTSTDGFILCNGVINGKIVQYLEIIYSPESSAIFAYGYYGNIFNNIAEEFSYGNMPTATVDIVF